MRFDWVRGHEHAPVWWNVFVGVFWSTYQKFPHRYAIPGKTRVRYEFYMLADEIYHLQDSFDKNEEGEGLVVGYEYSHQGPGNHRSPPPGTYTNNSKFPQGFIVKPDNGNELICVPIEDAELISGYGYAVPRFHALRGEAKRIGDLPKSLVAYPMDGIRFEDDALGIERELGSISFTNLGTPVYCVHRTTEEIQALYEERERGARATNRSWVSSSSDEVHSYVRGDNIEVLRHGNVHHLYHGNPEDLSFTSLKDEVRFWAYWAAEWINDSNPHSLRRKYDREEAIRRIESGEFDIAFEIVGTFTPIRLFARHGRFRERARTAGLEYLRSGGT